MNQASRGLAMAFGFVGVVLAFFLAGRGLDHWLGITPWAEVIGSLLGWVGGTLTVYYGTKQGI
jgi:F0F1-type ATP synthase assembly protein I